MNETSALPQRSAKSAELSGDAAEFSRRASLALRGEPKAAGGGALAWAPLRLDVLGGIAEYSGALVYGYPLASGVGVSVQFRPDRNVVLRGLGGFEDSSTGSAAPFVLDPAFLDVPLSCVGNGEACARPSWVAACAGAVQVLWQAGKLGETWRGLSLVVDAPVPPQADVSSDTALIVATMRAVCQAARGDLDFTECAHFSQRVENGALGIPCGLAAAMCVLHGEPGRLVGIDCADPAVRGSLGLPAGVKLIGLDCGTKHRDATLKYTRARTAAFMGKRFIEQLQARSGERGTPTLGPLARLELAEYTRRFSKEIPVKMKGADFVARYPQPVDALTRVEPQVSYRIRSRTEHHVHEGARTRKFAEQLAAAGRDRRVLHEIGDAMYNSHWGYGQRCGLGSVQTDFLYRRLREKGRTTGIYGARISGQGSGGVVVVLMDDSAAASAAVQEVRDEYERKSGLKTRVHDGSAAGTMRCQAYEVNAGDES